MIGRARAASEARRRWVRLLPAALMLLLAAPRAGAADPAPPFRLCADPDNLPFSSKSDTTPGFYVELGRDIAARLGRPFEPVWTPTYFTKRAIRTTLLAGQCDGFIGVPDDPDFMGPRLIFSKPVIALGYGLVVPKDQAVTGLADLAGRGVAVQFASPPQNLLATRNDLHLVTVTSPEEGMDALAHGRADAAFIWAPSAGWIDKTALHDAYKVVPVAGDHMQWLATIAFRREQTALRDEVDRALDALAASIATLADKYGFPTAAPVQLAATETTTSGASGAEVSSGGVSAPGQAPAAPPRAAASPGKDPEEIAAGHELFNANCSHCHGPDAVQGERRINLRLLHHRYGDEMDQVFVTTVTHGRVPKGMPDWSGILSDDQFRKILAFLHSVQEP